MADCGICLEPLKKPTSIPCGHIHCEKCLRSHILSGEDAFTSTCPTCRQTFYTATPDLAAVPEKYHEFIQPSIRKVFIDIPSISRLTKEISSLKGRVRTLSAEAKDLDRRCQLEVDTYRRAGKESLEKRKALELENNWLRDQYESLKVKYQTHLNDTHAASTSGNGGGNISVTVDMDGVSVRSEPAPAVRPKRALPKSRARTARHSDACDGDPPPQYFNKKPRVNRQSDVGTSSQPLQPEIDPRSTM